MSDNHIEHSHHSTKKKENKTDTMKVLSVIGIIALMLIPIFLSLHVRIQPLSLSGLDARIESSVLNNVYNQIAEQVRIQNPGVPDAYLAEAIDEQFQMQVNQPGFKEELDRFVESSSEEQKNYYRHEGSDWNYMQDIDTYHWLRITENIVETGTARDDIVDGKPWDTYVWAPIGRSIEKNQMLHPYIVASFHNLVSKFTDFTVERSYIYHSVFYALVVLLVFIVAWRISNIWGGFFAAMMIALVPGSLGRTLFGRASTDIWNVLFPLLILFLFLEAMVQKRKRTKFLFAGSAGLASVMFAAIWEAWWHVADFILAIAGIYVAYTILMHYLETRKINIKSLWKKPAIQNTLLITGIYLVSILFFGLLFLGKAGMVLEPLQQPFGALQLKDATRGSFFPNVHTTVAELRPVDNFQSVISALLGNVRFLGGNMNILLFLISIVGLILLPFVKRSSDGTLDLRYTIGLTIWILVTIFITFRGIRFVILLAPAFSVAFGIALGLFVAWVSKQADRLFKDRKNEIVGLTVIMLLLLFFFTPQISTAYNGERSIGTYGLFGQAMDIARSDFPMVDDDFYNHLNYIKDNSNSDAIMTSWWDFGHYFKYLADRRVTFDGGTQSSHAAHWAGRLFITDDEREAVGIKRMLDCSAAFTFIRINENVEPDEFKALYLIEELITLDEQEARIMLSEKNYSEQNINYVLEQTHCEPSTGLVVASGDMQGKAGVWGHFGSWSFERADVYNKIQEGSLSRNEMALYIQERLGVEPTQAAALYHQLKQFTVPQAEQWIAPYPSIFGIAGCSEPNSETIQCTANVGAPVTININRSNMEAIATLRDQSNSIQTVQIKFGYLNSDGEYIIVSPEENQVGLGASLLRDGDNYVVMLSDPAYVGSVFSLMYYYDGEGLSCFEPFRLDVWRTAGKLNTFMPNYDCDHSKAPLTFELRDYVELTVLEDDMVVIEEMSANETISIMPDEEGVVFDIEDIVSSDVEEASNESN